MYSLAITIKDIYIAIANLNLYYKAWLMPKHENTLACRCGELMGKNPGLTTISLHGSIVQWNSQRTEKAEFPCSNHEYLVNVSLPS